MSADAHAQMTPLAFIKKWKGASLTERQSAQEHFIDLCALLGHPTPSEEDPSGRFFAFEKGAGKVGGGRGFADVWKKDHFAWEYKQKGGNLDGALLQLMRYAPALENPPLHVVCDIDRFRIHTAWTNTLPATYEIELEDLANPAQRDILHHVFFRPEKLKPSRTRTGLTAEAADKFSTIALRLQGRGTAEDIAHFVNQLVFCFFAQSVALLPDGLFSRLLRFCAQNPAKARGKLDALFEAMEKGGDFDLNDIAWFNGGLFDGRRSLPLDDGDIGLLIAADSLDWSLIDPTIFGTLFERFLDPDKRAQIGAHYTDADKIARIIEPVILRPLRAEWETARQEIAALLKGDLRPPMREKERRRMRLDEAAEEVRSRFVERLSNLRILDPACGSGNFLYLALQGIKDIENRANLDCEMLGLQPRLPVVGPEILLGIEINELAAELARTTIWIGDIQWRLRNGIRSKPIPILRKLKAIEHADALVERVLPSAAGREGAADLLSDEPQPEEFRPAKWPEAEFIVGNPPFLGIRLMRQGLGDETVDRLFELYDGRVSREADLVCYWFEQSLAALRAGRTKRVGLVATNSVRGGANRKILDQIVAESRIFDAWSDEPWIVDGAAVRVSLICFGQGGDAGQLDGKDASRINPDLTAGAVDLTRVRPLRENRDVASNGISKKGKFEIDGALARSWILHGRNPHGQPNSAVLAPWRNGEHVTRERMTDKWIINFAGFSEQEAALFQEPFEHLKRVVKPVRDQSRSPLERRYWWRLARPASGLFVRLQGMKRYIATLEVAKHRLFVWLDARICPDKNLVVISREDDAFLGLLQSRFHEIWSLRLGTTLEDRPRYTCSTTFDTFPFPNGLTPDIPAVRLQRDPRATIIANAAKRLNDLRNTWLNPADLIRIEPEVVPGYPDRMLPKSTEAAAILRERTLTNLYNRRPQWLLDAHRELDAAVAEAYGWPADISDDDALAKLLELNLAREPADVGQTAKRSRPRTAEEARQQAHLPLPIPGRKPRQEALPLEGAAPELDIPSITKKTRSRRRAS